VTIPAANFVTSDTKTGIPFHARGPARILACFSRVWNAEKDYSKLGLLASQNDERTAQMSTECFDIQLGFLPFAKLRNARVNRNVGKSFSRLRLYPQ